MQVSSVQAAADAAKQAAEQGRSVMVYKITFSWGSGGYAAAESEVIQAIEAQGWRLEHFVKASSSEWMVARAEMARVPAAAGWGSLPRAGWASCCVTVVRGGRV
jgi:hypothetical protein